ncbi:hypothetical protein JX266_000927 [Neoarthrinium moseri]|nr:hypothetical protein JX266_000927 [Neoarthrinium moseri]
MAEHELESRMRGVRISNERQRDLQAQPAQRALPASRIHPRAPDLDGLMQQYRQMRPERNNEDDYVDNDNDDLITIENPSDSHEARRKQTLNPNSSRAWEYRAMEPPAAPTDGSVSSNPSRNEMVQGYLALCPFKLIQVYPYKYVGRNNQGKVGAWFKTNLFNQRSWEMYYIHDPYMRRDPLILVPTTQLEDFLTAANSELHTNLAIPGGENGERFNVTFGGSPRPRFMGHASSDETYRELKDRLGNSMDDTRGIDAKSLQFFKDTIDGIYNSFKPSKKNPANQHLKMVNRQKSHGQVIKRVQRYLGLRQRTAYAAFSGASDNAWSAVLPAPFPMELRVRFVCVDVEAYERDSNMITEIGLAILDTDDIEEVPPGQHGENWFSFIHAHHIRISEHRGIVNREFVQGCPDAFDFGKSEFIPIKDVARRVGSLIDDSNSSDKSPVVMVGHDTITDLKYLQKVGYNVWRLPQFLDEVDTKAMFQRVQCSGDGRALRFVCSELGIPGRNFHNAGNDAVYTLRAMVAMAVKKKVGGPQTESEKWSSTAPEVKLDEWSDGELDDGSGALKSVEPVIQPPRQTQDSYTPQRW